MTDEHVALIFLGQERSRQLSADEERRRRDAARNSRLKPALRISTPEKSDVAIGDSAEPAVEPFERIHASGPVRLLFRLEQQRRIAPGSAISALNAEKSTEIAMVTANC